MNCGKCGVENLERAKYCRKCGADMSFEADRVPLDSMFFTTISCVMLGLVLVSLIYYVIKSNVVDQKLDYKENVLIYKNM